MDLSKDLEKDIETLVSLTAKDSATIESLTNENELSKNSLQIIQKDYADIKESLTKTIDQLKNERYFFLIFYQFFKFPT